MTQWEILLVDPGNPRRMAVFQRMGPDSPGDDFNNTSWELLDQSKYKNVADALADGWEPFGASSVDGKGDTMLLLKRALR